MNAQASKNTKTAKAATTPNDTIEEMTEMKTSVVETNPEMISPLVTECKHVNEALDATYELSNHSFILGGVTIHIPHGLVRQAVVEGLKRSLSKDTAGKVSHESIVEMITLWSQGYYDKAAKRRAEKTLSAASGKTGFKLPFGRLLIEKELEDLTPAGANGEAYRNWLTNVVQAYSDIQFSLFVEKFSDPDGETKSPSLIEALRRLRMRAEKEAAKALAEQEKNMPNAATATQF